MVLFNEFLSGSDTLRVYKDDRLLFSSNRDRLFPLLEYIDQFAPYQQPVVIFDKVMGNAAALLSIKAGGRKVYSPRGSQLAIETLDKYGIKYYLTEIVPYIQKPGGQGMCPMENMSLDKGPEEFYQVMRKTMNSPQTEDADKHWHVNTR